MAVNRLKCEMAFYVMMYFENKLLARKHQHFSKGNVMESIG